MESHAIIISTLPTDDRPVIRLGWDQERPTSDPTIGVLVAFSPPGAAAWVGNFAPGGWTGHSAIARHPDGCQVVVVAAGMAYVVDPVSQRVTSLLGQFYTDAYFVTERSALILVWHGIAIECFTKTGLRWRTRRISWDGIANVRIANEELYADTWDAPTQDWIPAVINLRTGETKGGAYTRSDPGDKEILDL